MNTNPKAKRILCYGDSNTWGHIPGSGERYPSSIRWTGVLQEILGQNFEVIEESLCGRTTDLDDPRPGREWKNGKTYLVPCLESHEPLDLVILMLGTNDLKQIFKRSAKEVAKAIEGLIKIIKANSPAKILLVSPPIVDETRHTLYIGAFVKSKELASEYEKVAQKYDCLFLDSATIVKPSPKDGIHLEEKDHRKLAERIALIIKPPLTPRSKVGE